MEELRDPAIKLFGKEIVVAETARDPVVSGEGYARDWRVITTGDEKQEKEEDELETDKDPEMDNSQLPMEEEETPYDDPEDDLITPPILEENGNEKPLDTQEDHNEIINSDQKPLKKPDKILPCPRCNSTDTKFCYYNNYNVNQPRHFCKGCQRYWTAGGTIRNVPVGAGRRKNKSSASHCHHITISEALHMADVNSNNGVINPIYGSNGTVLSFGLGSPKQGRVLRNGIFKVEKENGSDCSTGSSIITTSNSIEGGLGNASNLNPFNTQVPYLQGFPWPYPAVPNPGFCPPGYPMPIYPIPYWNCGIPGAWPIPMVPPPYGANQEMPNPTPTSHLGKHSRNGELLNPTNPNAKELSEPNNSERTILIPKILRIDDPDEAAKSSIWATLGINNDSTNRKGIFKAFGPKGDEKKHYVPETPSSIQANPAAMSRSLNFQEMA